MTVEITMVMYKYTHTLIYNYPFTQHTHIIYAQKFNTQEIAKSQKTNSYICKSCHAELQQKMPCVCCNRHITEHVCKMYNKVDYDFTNFIVSQCLQHVSNSLHDKQ